ncbi:MAG: H+transporting two-sector ATPase C subunit [Magnetococcales bacterium]|nr:H+transporting two-sector ATPase C subunit [Magnetococcales bacterium]
MNPRTKFALAVTLFSALLALGATVSLSPPALAAAASPMGGAVLGPSGDAVGWGYLAAALATGLSSLAAGYAVANVGSAAIGAVTEKPELLGRMLILVGLAEGIAIYGLIISILILNRLG